MKKISFRVRNFENEQFLTFNIDNDAELDEDILDYLEEEEPEGIVPVIFEEDEEFDTFSYDITDKIHLCELSAQEINAEMVLMVLRGVIISLLNMSEYRIPLSYLVLNRNYIYIDSDYKVEFVCIPLEEMKEEVDLTNFFRNFIASLRFEPSENGDYVAKLLTYVNNRTLFNLRNMLALVEEWMDILGIEIPDDNENEIYGEYQEIIDEEPQVKEAEEAYQEDVYEEEVKPNEEEIDDKIIEETKEENIDNTIIEDVIIEDTTGEDATIEDVTIEDTATEDTATEDTTVGDTAKEDIIKEDLYGETVITESEFGKNENPDITESTTVESPEKQEVSDTNTKEVELDSNKSSDTNVAESKPESKSNTSVKSPTVGVVIDDELDEFLAEKEKEDQLKNPNGKEDGGLKFRSVKVNRASIVQGTREEIEKEEAASHKGDLKKENEVSGVDVDSDTEADEKTSDEISEKKEAKSKRGAKKNEKKSSKKADDKKGTGENNTKESDEKETDAEDQDADSKASNSNEKEGGSLLSQTIGNAANTIKNAASSVPKVNPYLIRVNTDERIMITKQTFKLGKASMGVDYSISGNGAISRVHAIITGKDGEYTIKDNKSTNHTFVDGKSVEDGESAVLTDNCKIVLGDEEFIFKLQ